MKRRTLEELLSVISDPSSVPSNYSDSEIASIKSLADRFQTTKALGVIKDLKSEYHRESSLGIVSALARGYHRADDLESLLIDDEAKLRTAVFQRNPDAELLRVMDSWVTFRAPSIESLPKLPLGYAFKGGAARLALQGCLGKSVQKRKPRDLDLIRFSRAKEETDLDLAAKYMPDDLRHGFGVEKSESYEHYFSSRDLNVNEVFLISGKVYCSKRCLEDFLLQRIRISPHGWEQKQAIGRIYCKGIRLLSEARVEGDELDFPDFLEPASVSEFDIALHLNRALERGTRIAEKYVRECVSRGLLENEKESLEELRNRLSKAKSKKKVVQSEAASPVRKVKFL